MTALYSYRGELFPDYLKEGNACRFVAPVARQFCIGKGLDIGAGRWPLEGAERVDVDSVWTAMELPHGQNDYIFSSHCLEHLSNPIAALEHWKTRIRPRGVLFLNLPHPDMSYWKPQNCRKHLHSWTPEQMAEIVSDLGFDDVIHSQRDLSWSFQVVGWRGV